MKYQNNKIYFSFPDFWDKYFLVQLFLNLKKVEPAWFNDDVVLDTIYGSFPCPWTGGREIYGNFKGRDVFNIVDSLNSQGIGIRHTFNNKLLNKNHLQDITGNQILKISDPIGKNYNIQNGVTVASIDLADYISKNYPNFQIIWSTTLEIKDINTINKLSENNLMVISYTLNKKWDILNQLKYPENIEILCNEEGCIDNCPNREDHYTQSCQWNMLEFVEPCCCPYAKNPTHYYYSEQFRRESYITLEEIREKYVPKGFNKFKVAGRGGGTEINTIEAFVLYFIKPNHQNEARNILLNNWYFNFLYEGEKINEN